MNLILPTMQQQQREESLWRAQTLRDWGQLRGAPCLAARPERLHELRQALRSVTGGTLIAHGAGRSYGDAAQNGGGAAVLTRRLDRLLTFDEASGLLVAEPGVTVAEILALFLPRGWLFPTPPGTAQVTLGGAIANDVHGKNQHLAGSLGEHVAWFDLMLADGEVQRVSAASDPALFAATIGGIGLTGVITAVALRLQRVRGPSLRLRRRRIGALDAFLDGFLAARQAPWAVGWIDALAPGAALGRGILETAEACDEPAPAPRAARLAMPVQAPGWLLNPFSVRAFNALYWRRVAASGDERRVGYEQFLFPLDGIGQWNRLYGRRGFHQFQCVLPEEAATRGLRRLLEAVQQRGSASFLAVLKWMGREGVGMLSFARPGFSLALDIPACSHSRELLLALENITRDCGGRIYLAKDSALTPQGFVEMYPRHAEFAVLRQTVDPRRRLSSDMSRRLGLG